MLPGPSPLHAPHLPPVGEGGEENVSPFRTCPLSYQANMALFPTPHFVLLALCGPTDLKRLNLLLIDFFVRFLLPLGTSSVLVTCF